MEGDEKFITALRRIALLGGMHDYIAISSRELGDLLTMSQQSASKRILELLDEGLDRARPGRQTAAHQAHRQGRGDCCARSTHEYQKIFEMRDHVVIHGAVITGMGEGQYYVTQAGYQEQFPEKLGLHALTRAR